MISLYCRYENQDICWWSETVSLVSAPYGLMSASSVIVFIVPDSPAWFMILWCDVNQAGQAHRKQKTYWQSKVMKCTYIDCLTLWRCYCTAVLREADGQRALIDLLLEQVLLVEEQDDGRFCEPLVVADWIKQLHALVHPVLGGTGIHVEIKRLIESTTRAHKGNESTETPTALLISKSWALPWMCLQ